MPSISSNIQIIASLLLSWITGLLGLVTCFFSFWLYFSLCFPPPFNLQTMSTIVTSTSLVTSVQLTVLPLATKCTWTPDPTSFSSLVLLPLYPSRASPPSVSNSPLPRPQLLLLLHSVPVSVPLCSVCCGRILGTRFLICLSPPTHMTTTLKNSRSASVYPPALRNPQSVLRCLFGFQFNSLCRPILIRSLQHILCSFLNVSGFEFVSLYRTILVPPVQNILCSVR